MQRFFRESTGVTLPIVTDNAVNYTQKTKAISVGNTRLATAMGVSMDDYALGQGDFLIKTVKGCIFILVNDEEVIRSAVMEYLKAELGVEFFTSDCYSIDQYGSDYVLTEINQTYEYDTVYRFTKSKFITADQTDKTMGYSVRGENLFGVSASAHQTLWFYAPPSTFNNPADPANYHPKWFYDAGETAWTNYQGIEQVCFTAHGDESELQRMKEQFLSVMINHRYGLVNGGGRMFVIGNEDNVYRCDCEACQAVKDVYGTDNATALLFCNDLAEMMEAWMQTEEGKPYAGDFEILFLTYEADLMAPVKKVELGGGEYKFEPINGLVCHEHVSPFFAPAHMDNKRSIYDEVNRGIYDAYEGWKVLSDEISLYLYEVNFRDYLTPYDCITYMQELYQYFGTANVRYINSEGDEANPVSTGWKVLTTYLQSVLAKDFDADVEAATDRFFENYFGVAAENMRKYYDAYLARMQYLNDNGMFTNHGDADHVGSQYIYQTLVRQSTFWSENPKYGDANTMKLLNTWLGYVEAALDDIAPLQSSDPALYQTLYDRITLERISILYLSQELASMIGGFTYDFNGVRNTIKTDCIRLGITNRGYLGALEDLYKAWGIA